MFIVAKNQILPKEHLIYWRLFEITGLMNVLQLNQ